MALALQIVLLVIGAGGAIVSALALHNPKSRTWCVIGFASLGLIGLLLTIVTYESTSGVPHFMDFVGVIAIPLSDIWQYLLDLAQVRAFQIGLAFVLGFALFPLTIWIYRNFKNDAYLRKQQWFTCNAIGHLGDKRLMTAAQTASDRLSELEREYESVQAEIQSFGSAAAFRSMAGVTAPTDTDARYAAAVEKLRTITREMDAQRRTGNSAFRAALDDLYDRLRNEELVAKGCLAPIDASVTEQIIPAWQWRFLKFTGDYTEASGEGIAYKAIAVARNN
jgi:drug/metabolite transporter superfamily protein YnfA